MSMTIKPGFKRGNQLGLKHGQSKTPAYKKWISMKSRCACKNPNSKSFQNYVARGIKVCPQWSERFETFLQDMGDCPSPAHELDRIDNCKGYEPGNCRWVTHYENQMNKPSVRMIAHNGKAQCARAWAAELGIHYATLIHRLKVGWTVEQSLGMRPKFGNRKAVAA